MQINSKQHPIALILWLVTLLAVAALPVHAQEETEHRARLIVQYGRDDYVTLCLTFPEERLSGLQLLSRSGLNVATWGTAVCRIEGVGCDYPVERCFCQCLASPCRFWSYWQWQDGRWVYSQVGASQRGVRNGDIDGWVWGDGQVPPSMEPSADACPPGASKQQIPSGTPTPVDSSVHTPQLSANDTQGPISSQYVAFAIFAVVLLAAAGSVRAPVHELKPRRLHTLSWLGWLGASAYLALVNQQPLHSVLLIMAVGVVFHQVSRRHPESQGWISFLRLGLWVWLVALAFNLLSVHAGNQVIIALPQSWPVVGGPITVEALLYGLASGASLFGILLVFAAFNMAVEPHRLLRWVPAGLYQAGLVASIALSFVPQMMASSHDIREAQRVRGHTFRGLRDWIPLFVPLLTTALERSLTLAESMEARGFGGIAPRRASRRSAWASLAAVTGLVAVLVGLLWRTLNLRPQMVAIILLGMGIALIAASIRLRGQLIKRTHYPQERWQKHDTVVTLACVASWLLTALTQARAGWALAYYPYPPLSPWPSFAPWVGAAAALLTTPALVRPGDPVSARVHCNVD